MVGVDVEEGFFSGGEEGGAEFAGEDAALLGPDKASKKDTTKASKLRGKMKGATAAMSVKIPRRT